MSDYVKAEYRNLAENDLLQGNRASMLASGYTGAQLDSLPPRAIMGLACGNPVGSCDLKPGMRLIDLGCGGGTDVILAGLQVAPGGLSVGLDFLPEMIERARVSAEECTALDRTATAFQVHDVGLGQYPFDNGYFDYVISNCCISLVDQERVFGEVLRILRPGGYLVFCEVAYEKTPMPPRLQELIEEAMNREITPSSDGSFASKVFRIYVTLAKQDAIRSEKTLELLRQTGFVDPGVIHQKLKSQASLEPPEMESERLTAPELREFSGRLRLAFEGADVNDYMTFATIRAKKPRTQPEMVT